ncbi:MAG: hypothetical protein JWN73_3032 [Betaproteobacteria bacterium]|nr:hypothetical protein [Betaproteobacteria bacterium]
MQSHWSNFWVQGSPEIITGLLGLDPTSVRRNSPCDYWDHGFKGHDVEQVVDATIAFLRSIQPRLALMAGAYQYGLLFGTTVANNGADTFHFLEPKEMRILLEMNLPVAFQTICNQE